MTLKVRFIERPDLEGLLAVERAFNTSEVYALDEEGNERQVEVLSSWTLCAEDVLTVVRQSRDEEKGTYDTRTYVVRNGAKVEGGFSLLLEPDRFCFAFLVCPPCELFGPVLNTVLEHVKNKAWRANKRRKVVLYLRDRDEAGLRRFIPVLKENGFTISLKPDYYQECDGWECTWEAEN